MIVILVTKTLGSLSKMIEQEGHTVVHETTQVRDIITTLLEWSPHLVLIDLPNPTEQKLIQELAAECQSTRFVTLDSPSNRCQVVLSELQKPPLAPPLGSFVPNKRKLLFDPRYNDLIESGKLSVERVATEDSDQTELQELRLVWMLHAAKRNRDRAKTYQNALTQLEGGEFQEIGFRVLSANFHGPIYARTQIGKFLGLLAHAVPGVDIESLPVPGSTMPSVRFVEFGTDLRIIYALHCLSLFGFDEHLYSAILRKLDWFYTGQEDEETMRSGMDLCGLLFTLRTIVAAHDISMEWLLHPQSTDVLDISFPRSLLRARQIFAKFWGLTQVVENSKRLKSILTKFSADSPQPAVPSELKPPSFQDFYNLVCSCDQKGSPKSK